MMSCTADFDLEPIIISEDVLFYNLTIFLVSGFLMATILDAGRFASLALNTVALYPHEFVNLDWHTMTTVVPASICGYAQPAFLRLLDYSGSQ